MSAIPAEWPGVVHEYRSEFSDIGLADLNVKMQAETDLNNTLWRLRQGAKRKASTSWSLPSELLLLSLSPSYVSKHDRTTVGIGALPLSRLPSLCPSARAGVLAIIGRTRATNTTPIDALRSSGFLLDKHNGKRNGGQEADSYCLQFLESFLRRSPGQEASSVDEFAAAVVPRICSQPPPRVGYVGPEGYGMAVGSQWAFLCQRIAWHVQCLWQLQQGGYGTGGLLDT